MTRLVVIIGFCVAFAAGLIVGMETRQTSSASPTSPPTTRSWRGPDMLTTMLNLTPQQQEQMTKIWSEVARHGRGEQEEQRSKLRRDRDEAIAALIRPQDREKYVQINKGFSDEMGAMNREMRARFDEAVAKTKPILTPEQRTKYEEFLNRHQWDRSHGDRDNREHNRPVETPATSRPGPQP